jgi:hypothetical protein
MVRLLLQYQKKTLIILHTYAHRDTKRYVQYNIYPSFEQDERREKEIHAGAKVVRLLSYARITMKGWIEV